MKRILVPTDFSSCAQAAGEMALLLATKTRASLYYLHLVHEPMAVTHVPHTAGLPDLHDPEIAHCKDELKHLVEVAEHEGVSASPILVYDGGNESIESYVEALQIDLVIMGSHGISGIKEWMLGSNTQRMVRTLTVPVLVIKQLPKNYTIKNILFASTFRDNVEFPFKEVCALASLFNATVNMVCLNMVDNLVHDSVAHERMKSLADNYPKLAFTFNVAETNDKEWAISKFADELDVDLIVIEHHQRSGVLKYFTASSVEHIVNHETRPVLVIKTEHS